MHKLYIPVLNYIVYIDIRTKKLNFKTTRFLDPKFYEI